MAFDRKDWIGAGLALALVVSLIGHAIRTGPTKAPPAPPPPIVVQVPVVKKDRFPIVVERTLVHEGSQYTNIANDPGGPTKWGVTIYDVRNYLKPSATAQDVKNLTKDDAIAVYRKHYWEPLLAGGLPPGLDYVVFDYGVNAGISRSGKSLRRAVGFGDSSGDINTAILDAVAKENNLMLIHMVSQDRMHYQMGLPPKFDMFKKGWRRRIDEVLAMAVRDASGVETAGIFGDMILVMPAHGKAPSYLDDNPVERPLTLKH